MKTSETETKCWCGHLERWHAGIQDGLGICRWCYRQSVKHPEFNWSPYHEISTSVPEAMSQRVADILDEELKHLA